VNKKQLVSLLLSAVLVLSLAACGGGTTPPASSTPPASTSTPASSSEPAPEPAPEPEGPTYEPATVRVAYMPNLGSAGSLFVGMDQGYFEEVGLTVEVYEFQGGPAEIAAMASGDIDISQIGHGAHALCIEGQAAIFQMDHTTSLSDVVVGNKSHGINTAADLKGKTVAVQAGTSSEIILQQALKKAGLSVEDINTVEMTVDGMTTAMITGQVDAAAAWSPNTITLQDALGENYVNLGGNADFLDSAIFPSSYITTTKYAQENKDILVRFAQALNKAHDYRLANQEYMAKLLAKELDAPEDTMIRALGEADWETITKDCGNMDAIKTIYETQQQIFINNGRIPEAVPVENYVLFDVMEEAYKAYSAAK
jgi:NitT/TauT family transport system substrate-binding protein